MTDFLTLPAAQWWYLDPDLEPAPNPDPPYNNFKISMLLFLFARIPLDILIDQGLSKRRGWFLNFWDVPLMTYRQSHFLRDKGENIFEKKYIFEFFAETFCDPLICF